MIIKKHTFGIVEDVTFLQFGAGDISVSDITSQQNDYTGVIFKQEEIHEIGEIDPSVIGKTTDEICPDVVMIFTNPASIDVVIEKLNAAKEKLILLQTSVKE